MEKFTVETAKFANHCGYSDVNPFEIVKVNTPRKLTIRKMNCESLPWEKEFYPGGFFGHTANQHDQKWEITSDEEAELISIRYSKRKGGWFDKHGRYFRLNDHPIKFYDYNF